MSEDGRQATRTQLDRLKAEETTRCFGPEASGPGCSTAWTGGATTRGFAHPRIGFAHERPTPLDCMCNRLAKRKDPLGCRALRYVSHAPEGLIALTPLNPPAGDWGRGVPRGGDGPS